MIRWGCVKKSRIYKSYIKEKTDVLVVKKLIKHLWGEKGSNNFDIFLEDLEMGYRRV